MKRRLIPNLASLNLIDDQKSFSGLAPRIQEKILLQLDWILKIDAADYGKKAKIIHAAAMSLDVSIPTVGRIVRRFKTGGWQSLLDTRGKNREPLPADFRDFVRQLHLQCQRATTGREVQRMLIERWRLWQRTGDDKHAIPGYETPPEAGPKGYPNGWSDDNVLRFRPDAYALSLARQGSKRAAGFLPSIMKTRVGMHFGQVVFFDDQDYDVKIAAPGSSQRTLRPQGFNCLDYLSGCFMHHAIRLRWWDKENEQYRTLTQGRRLPARLRHSFDRRNQTGVERHGRRSAREASEVLSEHRNHRCSRIGGIGRDAIGNTARHGRLWQGLGRPSHYLAAVHHRIARNPGEGADLVFRGDHRQAEVPG